ncbi:MAG TPA: YHS domain-containing protein [Alphaproteobacteria bacterium]|nr:YHS domain-containing protein [Alphaproteobacteria bacterium]
MDTLLQFLLIGGVFFLLMRFGCGSHMGRGSKHGNGSGHGHDAKAAGGGGCCGGGGKKHAGKGKHEHALAARREKLAPEPKPGGPPEKDTDPVCGKEISTETAKPSFYDGLVYYFCSRECRDAFEASPMKYLGLDLATEAPHLEH